jgi:hypothetical protein
MQFLTLSYPNFVVVDALGLPLRYLAIENQTARRTHVRLDGPSPGIPNPRLQTAGFISILFQIYIPISGASTPISTERPGMLLLRVLRLAVS